MYGVKVRVGAPVEMYDALHAEVLEATGAVVDGRDDEPAHLELLRLHRGCRTGVSRC